jgi:serine/threonine protein kinase
VTYDISKYEPLFGAWTITKLIGEGSFGKVYEIERKEMNTSFRAALKHITIPTSQSELKHLRSEGMDEKTVAEYLENFVGEVVGEFVLMSKLKGNSNVVSYEDHQIIKHNDSVGWDILIRMELLTNLIDHITSSKLGVKDVIKLGIDICKALELCQKHNIVHRDIKPENIFISDNGDYKLGDFGIARQVEKIMTGLSNKGTYTYMAPEVYIGEPYGSTVDVYSLGIVMYQLLNKNRTPFLPYYGIAKKITHNDKEQAFIRRMRGESIPKPAGIDGRLAEIVLKAVEFKAKDRYSSPLHMREELESIMYDHSESQVIYPDGDHLDIHTLEYAQGGDSGRRNENIRYDYDNRAGMGGIFGYPENNLNDDFYDRADPSDLLAYADKLTSEKTADRNTKSGPDGSKGSDYYYIVSTADGRNQITLHNRFAQGFTKTPRQDIIPPRSPGNSVVPPVQPAPPAPLQPKQENVPIEKKKRMSKGLLVSVCVAAVLAVACLIWLAFAPPIGVPQPGPTDTDRDRTDYATQIDDIGGSFFARILRTDDGAMLTDNGGAAETQTVSDDARQILEFTKNNDGTYMIQSIADDLVLTAFDEDGVIVLKFAEKGRGASQGWRVGIAGDDVYVFGIQSNARMVLGSDSTGICIKSWDDSPALFRIDKMGEPRREWRHGGYELKEPYYEYEILVLNGTDTTVTRRTDNTKPDVTSKPKSPEQEPDPTPTTVTPPTQTPGPTTTPVTTPPPTPTQTPDPTATPSAEPEADPGSEPETTPSPSPSAPVVDVEPPIVDFSPPVGDW